MHNEEKFVYHPTDWISGVKNKGNDDKPNNSDIPQSESGKYNIGYDADADLEEE